MRAKTGNAQPTLQQPCNQGDDLMLAAVIVMSNSWARHFRQASSQTACGRKGKKHNCTKAYLVAHCSFGDWLFVLVCHQR